MVGEADFTVFATATPFENVAEAAYLAPSGLFDGVTAEVPRRIGNQNVTEQLEGFTAWSWMHGADIFWPKNSPPVVYWRKRQTETKEQQEANEWLLKISDAEGFVNAFGRILSRPNFAKTLVAGGEQTLMDQFSEEAVAHAYLS